jgi:cytochrome P450
MLDETIRLPDASTLPIAPLFDPAYKANPHPFYREWTGKAPFWASVARQPAVVAARHADVSAIYLDHGRFSSVKPPSPDMARFDFFNGLKDMTHTDPPDHGRLRRTVNPTFAPGSVARLETGVQRLIDDLIAPIRAGAMPFEVMEQIARPLSLEVLLGLLLDVPRADYSIFQAMTEAMALLGETTADGRKPQAYLNAWAAGEAYCRRVIAAQAKCPSDGVIGAVVRAFCAGTLSEAEVLVMVINLFVGGLSTIATLIGNAFVQILSHPDQHARLKADPTLAGCATDEVLRFDSPGLFNYKFASRDLDFGGLHIPQGTTVYLIHQAANFDPAVFPDPERFDIGRRARSHLSFGYGVHFCIGAHLARLVTRLTLASAMRDLPPLALDAARPVRYGGWEQERAPLAVWIMQAI